MKLDSGSSMRKFWAGELELELVRTWGKIKKGLEIRFGDWPSGWGKTVIQTGDGYGAIELILRRGLSDGTLDQDGFLAYLVAV